MTTSARRALVALLIAGFGCGGGNRHALETSVNAVTGTKTSPPPRRRTPELSFVNLKWGPLALAPGAAGSAELDVVNQGEQTSGPFRVAVYATLGRVVTANRTLLGSTDVASLASQAQHLVIPFTAPAAPGSYAVGIEIDDQRKIPSDDRSNNTSGPAQLLVK
jgi:hypothetical protein